MAKAAAQARQGQLALDADGNFEEKPVLAHAYQAQDAINSEAFRVDENAWQSALAQVHQQGWARVPGVLTAPECQALAAMYDDAARFRSKVVMQRHAFGQGEYQYFAYPLPTQVQALRRALYVQLQPLAEQWRQLLGGDAAPWPAAHDALISQCHAAGQLRPTPLLLRYGPGDYNCLHQDVYGALVFPLQVVVLLSQPGRDFDGGELVLTEQRPRMQSRVQVLPLQQGDAAIIAVRERPVAGSRGIYRVQHRHGVSTITRGRRHTLGVVFHDAQ